MFKVEARKIWRRGRAGASSRALPAAIAGMVLIPAVFGPWRPALSQQIQNAGFDVKARSREIVAHLNSVIQFYRSTTEPVQKAGEPNDVIYRDQAIALASQIAGFAFQSAKAEAVLMAHAHADSSPADSSAGGEQQRFQATQDSVEKRISDLQAREVDLDKEIASAKPREVGALQEEKKQVHGALDLANAMRDALGKIVGSPDMVGTTGLSADIGRLQSSVPELQSSNKIVAAPLITIESARSSGVTSQGTVLIDLIETRHALDALLRNNQGLNEQVLALRKPISNLLRGLIQQGQQISQQAETAAPPVPAAAGKHAAPAKTPAAAAATPAGPAQPSLAAITKEFKALSAASIPLTQEVIALEQSRANLLAWKTSVDREYASILHSILLRVLVIGIALGVIFTGGEAWRHATNKYIRDIRRRRQFLIVRRTVVAFLSALVILFGFVTQFNSLATFAGFITAGIAVGLQTILLSVAAYFFIIGRYGVKVGDRITIASVTGDVIDVGLVRFYMMELAGSGPELNPTGRVAVFSNAVLFQAGTPLYKQIPGTRYAWHELIVKLTDSANSKLVCDAVMHQVQAVYDGYRANIELQHQGVEKLMQASIDPPGIASRLQFAGGAFQLWVRFPVQINQAAETDEKLTRALLELIAKDPEIKSSVAAVPTIQASVRG